jgi:hypothetical protein
MLVQSCANSSIFLTHFDARFQQSQCLVVCCSKNSESRCAERGTHNLVIVLSVCVCGGGGGTQFLLLCRHDLMIPRIIAQHWPPGNSLGRQSCVCQATWQLHFFILEHLTIFSICRHTDWYVGLFCCKDVCDRKLRRLKLKWTADNSTTFFRQRWGLLLAGSGIFKSRHYHSLSLLVQPYGDRKPSPTRYNKLC